ncbi:MAG: hypothetical protein HKN72_16865 [Gemmatimonadetes bacterium]|nr:hypothetical protein [Gemmatimonadota bacterium]NNF14902.1 hypothetical protein [Gemmatimonadota bacterium]NNL30858.1 hypothetical protein [Gemmatimonadota bacterium]
MKRWPLILLLVLVLPLAGCRTWQPAGMSPEALLEVDPPPRVRVTRTDGEVLTLLVPEIRAGALIATAAPGAVMIEDIRLLEVQRIDVLRTVAFVLPGAILVALVGKESCRC